MGLPIHLQICRDPRQIRIRSSRLTRRHCLQNLTTYLPELPPTESIPTSVVWTAPHGAMQT
jgi:hypothetical protein